MLFIVKIETRQLEQNFVVAVDVFTMDLSSTTLGTCVFKQQSLDCPVAILHIVLFLCLCWLMSATIFSPFDHRYWHK